MPDTPSPPDRLRRPRRARVVAGTLASLALLAAAAAVLLIWQNRPRLTEDRVRDVVMTTIQRESPASFLVTGQIDLTATTTSSSETVFLPGILDLGISKTRTTIRVPARASYGVDVREVRPELIRLMGDSVVTVTLPPVRLHSVAPNLAGLEIHTDRGWIRRPGSGERLQRRALLRLQDALREQAESHLETSVQPRVNTARAMERLLRPVLIAAGMPHPRFRFELGDGVVVEPERTRSR